MPALPTPRMAICLAVDLKRSTATGLAFSTKKLDRFNIALIQQFAPHLQAVGLEDALVKFTGDGWLVISDNPDDASAMCCLAILMACRFRGEMAREVGLSVDGVPALRLAVCWGRDLMVELPGGGRDFVGDSVRHAVRATGFCRDDEILIDDTVLRWVHHDFSAQRLSLDERRLEFPEAKMEQDLALHILTELRPESAGEGDAPAHFVNTLNLIGRETEAEGLAEAVYKNQAPRGAQTWEVPLHTPDILASAHLVRAFVRGFELTGERAFLDSATYWAWTGVPFVYLRRPTDNPVGEYATIAVYGATQWEAPNWIGLPVQWCGLVYADALYDLLKYKGEEASFRTIADGIVASGVQQTWPAGGASEAERARQGLLPDSFNLPGQVRNDVCINPATVQIPYARLQKRPLYTCHTVQPGGPFIHVPARVRVHSGNNPDKIRFTVDGAATDVYTVLVSGLSPRNRYVRVNGWIRREAALTLLSGSPSPNGFVAVTVRGRADVEVSVA